MKMCHINRKILLAHEQLEQIAREHGSDPAGLSGEIPF